MLYIFRITFLTSLLCLTSDLVNLPDDVFCLQTVDRPKDWYKTMFKQIHKVHKAGESVPNDTEQRKAAIVFLLF